MMIEDSRINIISAWLDAVLGSEYGAILPASSDASFRRYFRIASHNSTFIVMDAPPERENIWPFLKVARLLTAADIQVPQIYNYDVKRGLMLLQDFGAESYLDRFALEDPELWYQGAMHTLFKLQTQTLPKSTNLPSYDVALLSRELGIFYEWFLNSYLSIEIPEAVQASLNSVLIDSALQQPYTVVHRDFHSRNLMALADYTPGVLDFQDAVIGPITYDLVSLLKDCYIAWPEERVNLWRDTYFLRLQQAGILQVDAAKFKQWFDWMGLQRHLKAIGIFARLHLRDGKSGYLPDIPRTLAYVMQVTASYAELNALHSFLQDQVMPRFEQSL